MSTNRRVNFRDSPPAGSRNEHRRNDSGVGGPFSDTEDRSPRASTPSDYGDSYSTPTIPKLQKALVAVSEQRDFYKKKAEELDDENIKLKADLSTTKNDLKEKEAQWRGVREHNEVLEGEKNTLFKKNKQLQEEIHQLQDQLRRANRKSSTPPSSSMSGAIPTDSADDRKPRRSSSKRHSRDTMSQKDIERAERHAREKEEMERQERLRKRLGDRGDESDATGKSSNTSKGSSHRSRRSSYIEPMGPPAVRPTVPPSPSRAQYPAYSQTQYAAPQFTPMQQPNVASIPRSITRPAVYYENPIDDDDGNYHNYPLPRQR
ncbi:hypothetical protein B0H66DRAFT_605640 [Apodospora peruviana]|uniref:Uncharacterized protein n=1 Tax=Apodospora peruviana TaxID=516989 RepID=A0AAE0HZC2_9PEZI|nr:hypothetical protein B0H66DRAFT_605640 [Apodospora peruviana]